MLLKVILLMKRVVLIPISICITSRQLHLSDIADVNIKISGKSDGRQELPEKILKMKTETQNNN